MMNGPFRAAPKLKDADISEDRARELYLQLVKTMRTMYHTCRLVHADLSEYNLLYVHPPHPTPPHPPHAHTSLRVRRLLLRRRLAILTWRWDEGARAPSGAQVLQGYCVHY